MNLNPEGSCRSSLASLALAEMAMIAYKSSGRLLIKPASGVLASLRGSTYRSVRLASSLAAALLDGLSEQPAGHSASVGGLG